MRLYRVVLFPSFPATPYQLPNDRPFNTAMRATVPENADPRHPWRIKKGPVGSTGPPFLSCIEFQNLIRAPSRMVRGSWIVSGVLNG